MSTTRRQRVTAGLALIALGLGLYWLHRVEGIGEAAVFFLVGGAFLAAYLYNRAYGFLVPAGIMLGMGAGMVGADSLLDLGRPQFLGLGFGFVLIFLIALLYERRSHWWPLIPGTLLILLGLPDADRIFSYLYRNWPLILVIAGALILLTALGRSGRTPGDAGKS